MIKIFNATDTDFSSNGEIVINPLKCIETKKKSLNGWYIDVEIPIKYLEYIVQDKLCVVKVKSKLKPQAFRIGNIDKTERVIKFQAEHVMFDSRDYFLLDVRPTNLGALNTLAYINERTDNVSPFVVSSDVGGLDTCYFIRKNLLDAWSTIEERFGGSFDADNFNIQLKQNVGIDRGEMIVYGKNQQHIRIYEDWSSVVTKICPVGKDGMLLPETYISSDVQYEKPYTKTISFETNLDQEEQIESNLILELREKANSYIEENKYPKVSYEVKADLNELTEIGDIIHVKNKLVNLDTEVLEYQYNIISNKLIEIIFGNFTRDIKKKFDAIKDTQKILSEKISNQEKVVNEQTNIINNLNKLGTVYIDDNEILILDVLPKENAQNVLKIGLGGIGFSETGYEGPFESAWTLDGVFNADRITTGTMSVERIQGLNQQLSLIVNNIDNLNIVEKTAEGTDIILTDNAEQFAEVTKIEGASSQVQTTNGKNKFDTENGNISSFSNITLVSRDNTQITVDKPANGSGGFTYRLYLNAGSYVLRRSFTALSGTPIATTGNVNLTTDAGSFISYLPAGTYAYVFTIATSGYYKFSFLVANASTVDDIRIKFYNIQIEAGTSATAVEVFTPNSPSFDYPSKINNAIDIPINAFSTSFWQIVNTGNGYPENGTGGVTTNNSSTTGADITTTTTYKGLRSDYFPIVAGKTYLIEGLLTTQSTGIRFFVTTYNSSKVRIQTEGSAVGINGLNSRTFIATQDGFVTVAFASTVVTNNMVLSNIRLINKTDNTIIMWSHKKNLFDKSKITAGKYINNLGGLSTDANSNSSDYIPIISNTQYICNNPTKENIAFYDGNKIFISYIYGKSFTTPVNARYLRSTIKPSTFTDIYQLEQGTVATTYEPYTGLEYPVTLPSNYLNANLPDIGSDIFDYVVGGKNLFNKAIYTADRYLNNLGQETATSSWNISDYIDVENLLNVTLTPVLGTAASMCFYDINKVFISGTAYGGDKNSMSFNIPVNTKYIRFSFTSMQINNTQLEQGLVPTIPQPFGLVSGNYFVKRINEIVLNGSEASWAYNTVYTNTVYLSCTSLTGGVGNSYYSACCCDKFKSILGNSDIEHCRTSTVGFPTSFMLFIDKGRIGWVSGDSAATIITKLKAYLDSNPILVQYLLGMPIYIPATLPKIQTFKDYTKITSLTTVKPKLYLNYINNNILNNYYLPKIQESKLLADNANNLLSDIANDSKLTASEKQKVNLEIEIIKNEKIKLIEQANKYDVDITKYITNYDYLINYITILLENLNETSDIESEVFKINFKNYYDSKQDLLNSIENNINLEIQKNKSDILNIQNSVSEIKINSESVETILKKTGGNNLIKNSAMKNGTAFWLEHLKMNYITSDTPPTTELFDGKFWYCTKNIETFEMGNLYLYNSGNWTKSQYTKKYLDDTNNLMIYTSQKNDDDSRKNTISNSIIKLDAGENLEVSHIFNAANVIDVVKDQEYITLSFKIKNSMITGVGYVALGFLHKYLDESSSELLYSIYEPSFLFTPDEVTKDGMTEIVITTKIPKKQDFLEVIASPTSPIDTSLLWLDTSVMLTAGILKEYKDGSWVRKLTTATCYDVQTRLLYPYRQIFDFWYQIPVNFDDFEIRCIYPAFTMYPEFIRLIPSTSEPTPFKGAYWLKTDDNIFRAKYNNDNFESWLDTGISTTYLYTHTYPNPPFPSQYGVPIKGYYEVADIKAEWNNINTIWNGYFRRNI